VFRAVIKAVLREARSVVSYRRRDKKIVLEFDFTNMYGGWFSNN
jgi:hypothetical protein